MSEPFNLYNEFVLKASPDRITKLLARYELYRRILDVPGDIVEGGVMKGAGVLFWAKLVEVFNPLSKRKVVGFDTFAGYPDDVTFAHDQEKARAFTAEQVREGDDVSAEAILAIAAEQGLAGRIELVKGDVRETLPDYIHEHPGFRIALLNLDFVLYDPTRAALEHLYPLVVPGGIVAFDEYATRGNGESDAVDEFFKGQDIRLHSIPWALSPTAYLIKGER
ncbi:MAG: class I SAM-dependent methyltransferase [Chloroflexi bacterium]|nr:class I SAM-dependent methyltransferase [Chloroflexota bacterium]